MPTASEEQGPGSLSWIADPQRAWRWIVLLCAVYLVAFACFYPQLPVNDDEAQYIRQTRLLLQGASVISLEDARTGELQEFRPSTYPIGTAVLMAPFVAVGGWRAAFVLAPLSLFAALWLLGRWLQQEGRSPAFALLLFGFVPTLVMGRVAMSDVPSAAIVALGLWLFWLGLRRGPAVWLAAGFVAGASAAFRPPNVLVFLPLCAGTVLRRDRNWWALALGGVAGSSLRLVSSAFVLGDAVAIRTPYILEVATIMERLPLFLFGLLVLLPGGLVLALLYRGERRPEVTGTVLFVFGFFLLQQYSSVETGFAKRIVLALRYFLPLLPLMIFAMAESVPRLWQGMLQRTASPRREQLVSLARATLAAWIAMLVVGAIGVNVFMYRWATSVAEIHDSILETTDGAVIVTNLAGTKKFIHELDLAYLPVKRSLIEPEELVTLAKRHGELYLVLLDRTDSEWWRSQTADNAAFVARLPGEPELLVDRRPTSTDRLRIWRFSAPDAEG